MVGSAYNVILLILSFVITYIFSEYKKSLKFKKYFQYSKEEKRTTFNILVKLFISILQLILIYLSVMAISNNKSIDGTSLIPLNIVFVAIVLIVDNLLSHILKIKGMFLKVDLVKLLQAKAYYLLNLVLIFLLIVFVNKTGDLAGLIQVQNQMFGMIPGWNLIILLPVFIVWLSLHRDHRMIIEKEKHNSRVDIFQTKVMFFIKDIAFSLLTVVLFMGGDNLFAFWDGFNVTADFLILVSAINFTVKYILLQLCIHLYGIFHSKKFVADVTNRSKSKVYIVLSYIICVCIFKVIT